MPKPTRRGRRLRSGTSPLVQHRDERPLLARILATPHLPQIVPRLQPEILHGVIQTCGLEDCAGLVALATPHQLMRVLDLDLWRSRGAADPELDADRFGIWLEVLLESGASLAAHKLMGLDLDLVTAALAEHLRVCDVSAVSPYTRLDGEEVAPAIRLEGPNVCEIGSYAIEARRAGAWEAIVAILLFLDANHPHYFHRVMGGCRDVSSFGAEIDGLDDLLSGREQDVFDAAIDREARLEQQGYVPSAQASAFLRMARQLQLAQPAAPGRNPVTAAYFHAIEWTVRAETHQSPAARLPPADSHPREDPAGSAAAIAAFVDVLAEAGITAPPTRALLDRPHGQATRLSRIHDYLQSASDRGDDVFAARTGELAYLTNTMAAGCSLQGRPFKVPEAADAVSAICNLGLENWPDAWGAVGDLVTVFQVGSTVLHTRVCMHAAERLVSALSRTTCHDTEIQGGLDALRIAQAKHSRDGEPWRARHALDAIMALSMPAWAALAGLIDECPVFHPAIGIEPGSRVRTVSASAFEFIAENSQIAAVHAFLERLPEALSG